jgi:c-di-GMP-binding flagellar brake protein YcgR
VPARRSRTQQWHRCLEEILERNGTLEIAIAREYSDDAVRGNHLIWRVRLLTLNDAFLVVEQPMALGRTVELSSDIDLVAVLAIGQNRWMFRTRTEAKVKFTGRDGRALAALRLSLPTKVERCQRRHHYRVHTATLSLPEVELWPLLDPKSVLLAERLNELQYHRTQNDSIDFPQSDIEAMSSEAIMPEVGPRLSASLLNLGGGGVGLQVRPEDSAALGRHKVYWMRFMLLPELTTPICASGKLVHTHVESSQEIYAGLAFDFSFNPGHQQLVLEQICKYIAMQQRAQMQESTVASAARRQSA